MWWQQQRLWRMVAVDGGQRSSNRCMWQVGAGPEPIVGSRRRRQVAITHHCILCRLTPLLLCLLCRQRRWHRMTTDNRRSSLWQGTSMMMAEDTGRELASPSPLRQISSPPMAPPSTISISFSHSLSTGDVVTAVAIPGDCRQWMTGLQQWAVATEAARGRCVWWEVRWETQWEVRWEVQWEIQWEVWWEVQWLVVYNKSFLRTLAFVTPTQATSYIRAYTENKGDCLSPYS
jgi:hypothetical protein